MPRRIQITLLSLAAIVAAGSLVAARQANAPTGGTKPRQGVCAQSPRRGSFYILLTIAGVKRSALVHVPRSAATGKALPVVLAFHGSGGSGRFMAGYSGLEALSEQKGFVAVFPTADPQHRHWVLDDDLAGAGADLQFVEQLLDRVEATMCTDDTRIYATGVSNGGGMVALLGCHMGSRLAAIAPVAGGYSTLEDCRPKHRLSVLEIHGTADQVVPYKGKPPNGAGSVPAFLAKWRGLDRCAAKPQQHRYGPATEEYLWSPCADGTQVEHLKIYGGGHAWPGATPADSAPTAPISAASAVWSFFRAHALAP